ncbi:hypothetical protein Q8F55_000488 [Vanrija albida]|uniref:GATA-type domain-containing protein n=1 Tax=Vanrija albida TaxID=181172 RepID=A0ABR3QED5_9TREE
MDPTLESTLQHVLDPALQGETGLGTPSATDPLPPHSLIENDVQSTPTSTGRQRRKAAAASPVDSRRREANRLAAERSRGRQQEKIIALEMAIQALGDENLRLREDIQRLEGRSADDAGTAGDQNIVNHEQTAAAVAAAAVEAANAVSVADAVDAQQDTNSRTILAALMSSAGVATLDEALAAGLDGDADSEAASWMQGVESLFKEAEASGRLGELAAVAAGQGGEGSTNDHSGLGDVLGGPSGRDRQASVLSSSTPASSSILASAASAVTAAINSEMEKLLQQDIAQTKTAIARVERELARLRGQPLYLEDGIVDEPVTLSLPEDLRGASDESVQTRTTEIQAEQAKLDGQAAVLREVVARMRDAHSQEERKLSGLVAELQALDVDGNTEVDREQTTTALKAVRAHITNLMNAPEGGYVHGALVNPFSSPATARRRRGRPPKVGIPPVKYTYSMLYSTPGSSDVTGAAAADSLPATPSARPLRASLRGKSRLANEIRASPPPPEAGPSNVVGSVASGVGVDVGANVPVAPQTTHAHDDYLLSHLTNATNDGQDAPIHLDSASFAAFLPQSPAANHTAPQLHGHDTTIESAIAQPAVQEDVTATHGGSTPPNILSRLKRGPPGSCDICGRTQTSVWRKLTLAGEDHKVCNACGLYHAKFGIIRPPELWGDGKSVKKRKASARASLGGAFESPNANKRKRKSAPAKFDFPGVEGVVPSEEHPSHDEGLVGPHEEHTLGDVGRAVENIFAVVQQQQEEQEQQQAQAEQHQQQQQAQAQQS